MCDVCGAVLNVTDCQGYFLFLYNVNSKLEDHFSGKIHNGYILMKLKIKELEEIKKKRDRVFDKCRSPNRPEEYYYSHHKHHKRYSRCN